MSDRITDGRRQKFFIIDNAVIDQYGPQIGVYGIAVYSLLARMASGKESAFPSYQTIADKLGMSRPKAISTVRELIAAGLITKTSQIDDSGDQTSNLYTLVDCAEVVNDINHLVNDINHGGKPDLPPLVNDVNPKNTNLKNTNLKKSAGGVGRANMAQSPETQAPPPPTHPVDLALPNPPTEAEMAQQAETTVSVRAVKYKRSAYAKGPYLKGAKLTEGYITPGAGINAVQVYHERNCADDLKLQLTDPQQDDLITAIQDLDQWRRVVIAWNQAGYNPKNLAGHLDWYRNGIPGEKGTHHEQRSSNGVHRTDHQAGQRPHYANYDDPGYDEERANELNGWA